MDKPSTSSLELPTHLPPKHIPMLSTTKLGSAAPNTSLALRRKTEIKDIIKYFEQLKPWQQKLMASVLIERCDGPSLEQLNNILQVLTHRDFQASFNQKYPAKALRSRIDYNKLEVKVQNMLDNIFTMKGEWKRSHANNKTSALRQMYLQEKWQPSAPIYYNANVTDFSSRIQEAVTKILREQDLPVAASPEAAADSSGIVPKPSLVDVTVRPSTAHFSRMASHILKHKSPLNQSSKQITAAVLGEVVPPEQEQQVPKSPAKPPSPSQLTLMSHPAHQSGGQRLVSPATLEDAEQLSLSVAARVPTVVQTDDLSTVAESLSLEETGPDISPAQRRPTISGVCTSGSVSAPHNYHQRQPSILLAFRPEITPTTLIRQPPPSTLSMFELPSRAASLSQHHLSAPNAANLPDNDILSAAVSTTLPTLSPMSSTIHQHTELHPMSDTVATAESITATDIDRSLTAGQNTLVRPISMPVGTAAHVDAVTAASSTRLAAYGSGKSATGSGSAAMTAGAHSRGLSRAPEPSSKSLNVDPSLRSKGYTHMDLCQTSFTQFEYDETTQQRGATPSDIIEVTEYIPTSDEEEEDNDMVKEFSDSVLNSLQTTHEHVNSEDELAEVVAECVLSSAVGLALLSVDPQIKISRSRFLNLRDRMSSEVMQATIKVFRIKPPSTQESTQSPNAVEAQLVTPFDPEPQPVMRKVSDPQTFFKISKWGHYHHIAAAKFRKSALSKQKRPNHAKGLVQGKAKVKQRGRQRKGSSAAHQSLYDKEAEAPLLQDMTVQDFCSTKSAKLCNGQPLCCQSTDVPPLSQSLLQTEFRNQLISLRELVAEWRVSEVVQLLGTFISLAYEQSVTVLPLIAKEVRARVMHVSNITELPDRMLILLFHYLDAESLQRCQEVCRRWAFLCSRPEIWIERCNQLGHRYGIPALCKRICDHIDSVHSVDWQLAYRELSVSLRRYGNPIEADLHPAILSSKGYSSQVNIPEWNNKVSLPPIMPEDSSSVSTPTAVCHVSDFTYSDNLHSDTTPSSAASNSRDLARQQRAQVKFEKKSKFPPLKLANGVLVMATEGSDSTNDAGNDNRTVVKTCDSSDTELSTSMINTDLFVSTGTPAKKASGKNRAAAVEKLSMADKSLAELAIDIRTDLKAAKLLNPMKFSHLNVASSFHQRMSLHSKKRLDSDDSLNSSLRTKASHLSAKSDSGSSMLWLNAEDYNPRDDHITKRFMGYVKPVQHVHKFRGQPDVIYCCEFDRNRVFTAGMDGIIYLWDKRSGRKIEELTGHNGSVRCLALDSVNNLLYSASWDTMIYVWDVVKLTKNTSFLGHHGAVVDIKLNRKRAILCSASYDGTIKIWSTRIYRCMQTFHYHYANVNCLYYDGDVLASGGAEGKVVVYTRHSDIEYHHHNTCVVDKTLKDVTSIGDIAKKSGQPWDKLTKDQYMVNSITSLIVINDLVLGGTIHGELCCWCKNTGSIVARFDLHIGAITSINLWCQRILTSGSDGVLKEWDLGTMTCVRRLHDHSNAINCVKVDEEMETLISVGDDKLIHLWYFAPRPITRRPAAASDISTRSFPSYAVEKSFGK